MNPPPPLEIWGGVECSVVRLAGRLEDQLIRTGHDARIEDLDRFANLGIRTLRYPILWERHHSAPTDWAWADKRLSRLRALGIRPIIGFVHHGGGPLPGGLLDDGFASGLARFARDFARRYPWIDAFTPINEPLTTARFSGLYGLWHPFGNDSKTFARILLNECEAVRAAMAAIREITPSAQLIQTEDVGKTHSTDFLSYQADFENERRWLTFDLLCGRLSRKGPVRRHLQASGITAAEIDSFTAQPCPPDILGVNYYVTSERFLDERMERYPQDCHGGNDRHRYADVPAVRVRAEGLAGPGRLIRELWERFRRPIAVTEVQLACTREEQLRWLDETHAAMLQLREEAIDVRAITSWALLGAYDWSSLLLDARGDYETGAFDCRSSPPRATAIAGALRDLTRGRKISHPALPGPGWWRRPSRLIFPAVDAPRTGSGTALCDSVAPNTSGRPLLIFGSTGTLGGAFVRVCRYRGLHAIALTRHDFDLSTSSSTRDLLAKYSPWAVVNAAGYVRVDDAEKNPDHCHAVNATACAQLATACQEADVRLVTFSSGLVFDGLSDRPYVESDVPAPLGHYGRSKYEAEKLVCHLYPDALVVRTSAFFGPWNSSDFASLTMQRLSAGQMVKASEDVIISPTYVPDLVHATLDLLIDGESGIWHAANQGETSWYDWARAIAQRAGCSVHQVIAASPAELGWIAPRPRYAALASERGMLLPHWEKAMDRFLIQRDPSKNFVSSSSL